MSLLPARSFYLIRHGQTDANVAKIISGGTDSDLTPVGIAQAEAVGAYMDRVTPAPARIVHSGRTRTRDTAAALNRKINLPVTVESGIDEHDFGDWIGISADGVLDRIMQGETPPNGESLAVCAARIQKALAGILEGDARLPLVVAHGGTFRAIAFIYGFSRTRTPNGVLHYFEPIEGAVPWRIWTIAPEGDRLRRDETELAAAA